MNDITGAAAPMGSPPRPASPPHAGILLLDKPAGITSFQALSPLKRALGTGKVGHAGTLDRFATGLLVCLVGRYSRLAPWVCGGEKEYRGLVRFGFETDTLDPEGEIVAEAAPPGGEELEAVLPLFRGPILQRPPAYSAVHVAGRRAYQRTLAGEEPELKERPVEIRELVLEAYEPPDALLRVRCSSGTYIRSLARDIAAACGSRAHLAALERLAIGPFLRRDAESPEVLERGATPRALSPKEASALGLRVFELGSRDESRFLNGAALSLSALSSADGRGALGESEEAAVFGPSGFLGVAAARGPGLRYLAVLGASR